MICPHCHEEIDDKEIAAHIGRKGGRKSKRVLSSEEASRIGKLKGKG